MDDLKNKIRQLACDYSKKLEQKIVQRVEEMKRDDCSHYLIYKVLGIHEEEGHLIDVYQNKGRFLYKYAGTFLEESAILCLEFLYPNGQRKVRIKNTKGIKPKTFEIDFLNNLDAIEIKWRDATTDGDHITKEHSRVKAISEHGYKPIRVMFYYPQREQAQKIQETLKTLYSGVHGEYYRGDEAWSFLEKYTGIDLKEIFQEIADEKVS